MKKLRLKKLRRRFGIAAPRVAVHSHVPWYWRWLTFGAFIVVTIIAAWVAYDLGRRYAGFDASEASGAQSRLQELNGQLQDENAGLRKEVAAMERQLQIELSAQGNLTGQIRALSEENALLKEDLAFFQTLMASGADPGGVTVNRFRVERDALPGEYRYHLLIVQSKQRVREFRGRLQLIVDYVADGEPAVTTFPANGDDEQAYNLRFKFYQRVEGTFTLQPEAIVRGVQVRVLKNGDPTPVSTQATTLS
ncbi:MAG: hypothetical protein JSU95_11565 [Betaproteobacteria bacterium]|nr:MAG: hypothetical protein JSU95_11565 [Betaproteobacteria bacterium]